VVKGGHEVGGNLACLVFGYGIGRILLTGLKEVKSQSLPDDIKTDIAKVVRSVDWRSLITEGYCFGRAATGHFVLTLLGIPAKLVFAVWSIVPVQTHCVICSVTVTPMVTVA
jgi:hypothetical protein